MKKEAPLLHMCVAYYVVQMLPEVIATLDSENNGITACCCSAEKCATVPLFFAKVQIKIQSRSSRVFIIIEKRSSFLA